MFLVLSRMLEELTDELVDWIIRASSLEAYQLQKVDSVDFGDHKPRVSAGNHFLDRKTTPHSYLRYRIASPTFVEALISVASLIYAALHRSSEYVWIRNDCHL